MAFCAIPAIDITKGSCVRLKQGLMNESTVYSENPVRVARRWINEKATRIHLVDLDGAFSGNQENTSLIELILQEFGEKRVYDYIINKNKRVYSALPNWVK